jgi:uncharacterized protein (DUF2235 family)
VNWFTRDAAAQFYALDDVREAAMAKNILIFSDGTGQGAGMPAAERSNVWKLWTATEKAAPGQQIAFYDEGLGAEHKKEWWRWAYDLASKATGLGISQNIKDCYVALIELYEPGDRVFLFGFSRGAYTVRSLGGVLSLCGIPQQKDGKSARGDKAVRTALAEEAVSKVYQHYGNDEKTRQERIALGQKFRADYSSHAIDTSNPPFPYFIGVWDTVRALGVPGSSGVSFVFSHAFHDATLNPNVPYARQALSIDENREIFAPEIWDESKETAEARARGRIKQTWFPGVHSDVGGGYAETGLSDLALAWMIEEATAIPNPVIVDSAKLALAPSFEGLQHDQRTGLGQAWKQGTREGVLDGKGPDILYEKHVGDRFRLDKARCITGDAPYRPKALTKHTDYEPFYKPKNPGG